MTEPRTPLGKRLLELREKAIKRGMRLLPDEAFESRETLESARKELWK